MVAIAGGAVAAVGSIAGGVMGGAAQSSAATKARRSQETAAVQQQQWARHMWNQEQADRAPWIEGWPGGAGQYARPGRCDPGRPGALAGQGRA